MTTTELPELTKMDKQVMNFLQVICGQHENLVDNGWLDVFCNDCPAQETAQMSPVEFAEHVIKLGWEIIHLESATAMCPECVSKPSVLDYAPGMSEGFARADERDNFGDTE